MTVFIWARRGLGCCVAALLVGFVVWTSVSSRPWQLEFDWAARFGAAYVYLLAPLVAAAVAYDVGRRARPEMTLLGATGRRGVMASLGPTAAVLGWTLLAASCGWILMAAITISSGGLSPRDPWVFIETVSSLAAAAAVGMTFALFVDGILAVAASAGAVLAAATLTSGHGANLFQVTTSSGTLVGIERTPQRAIATILCHLALIAVAVAVALARQRAHTLSPPWLAAAALTALVPIAVAALWPYSASEFRPSQERQACAGSQVRVCGPASASALLAIAGNDLSEATRKLQPSGLPLPATFVVARGSAAESLPAGRALLDLDSSQLSEGHLPRGALANAIATPRQCRGFYSAQESPALLEHVKVVSAWLDDALAAPGSPSRPPGPVAQAYAALSTCPPR